VCRARCSLLLVAVAVCACGDPSPLKPDPVRRVTGTYTFTAKLSASCPNHGGPWRLRADIEQTGRDLEITLYEMEFVSDSSTKFNRFRGQDNPDGLLFFAKGGDYGDVLFWGKDALLWSGGQARGPFRDGHIDAVFEGTAAEAELLLGVRLPSYECAARDHSWTFDRR